MHHDVFAVCHIGAKIYHPKGDFDTRGSFYPGKGKIPPRRSALIYYPPERRIFPDTNQGEKAALVFYRERVKVTHLLKTATPSRPPDLMPGADANNSWLSLKSRGSSFDKPCFFCVKFSKPVCVRGIAWGRFGLQKKKHPHFHVSA